MASEKKFYKTDNNIVINKSGSAWLNGANSESMTVNTKEFETKNNCKNDDNNGHLLKAPPQLMPIAPSTNNNYKQTVGESAQQQQQQQHERHEQQQLQEPSGYHSNQVMLPSTSGEPSGSISDRDDGRLVDTTRATKALQNNKVDGANNNAAIDHYVHLLPQPSLPSSQESSSSLLLQLPSNSQVALSHENLEMRYPTYSNTMMATTANTATNITIPATTTTTTTTTTTGPYNSTPATEMTSQNIMSDTNDIIIRHQLESNASSAITFPSQPTPMTMASQQATSAKSTSTLTIKSMPLSISHTNSTLNFEDPKTPNSIDSNTSKRRSLPLDLRNKKMKPTDCLLFAATLLEHDNGNETNTDDNSVIQSKNQQLLLERQQQVLASVQSPLWKSSSAATLSGSPNNHPLSVMVNSPTKQLFMASIQPKPSTSLSFPSIATAAASAAPTGAAAVAASDAAENPIADGNGSNSSNNINYNHNNAVSPRDVDVLCGRGGLINKHPGNVVYRRVVDYNKPFYQTVHKKHRILVSQSIVQAIKNYGGRFLVNDQHSKDGWVEIEYKRAVQKTSQALRERTTSSGADASDSADVDETVTEDDSNINEVQPKQETEYYQYKENGSDTNGGNDPKNTFNTS